MVDTSRPRQFLSRRGAALSAGLLHFVGVRTLPFGFSQLNSHFTMASVSTIDLTSPNAEAAPVLTFGEGELLSASGKMADNTPEFAPGKEVAAFRVYQREVKEGSWDSTVQRHYHLMRTNQTVAFVDRMLAKYSLGSFGKREVTPEGRAFVEKSGVLCTATDGVNVTVHEMFELLKSYIDSSDPDCETPNKQHMMQTSERARAAGEPDHFVLACLIHDMGKAMYLFGTGADGQEGTASGDQWALGGDTWVVGARIPDCTVYPEFNRLNADMADPRYNTENGVYEPGCGIMNLKYAYGHDQYIYDFCLANGVDFPEETLAILRLHSCYPWHRGGAYRQFMKPGDEKLLAAVLRFNSYDLYSKSDAPPDVEALWPYYQGLIDKYMPGKLKW